MGWCGGGEDGGSDDRGGDDRGGGGEGGNGYAWLIIEGYRLCLLIDSFDRSKTIT